MSFAEREQIAVLAAARLGVRAIAREVGRDPGTISRELRRVLPTSPTSAWERPRYLASLAQADADTKAARPKACKLATNLALRAEVIDRLRHKLSPEQISARLKLDYPGQQEMQVSHETIYDSLYVQGRGGLKRELTQHLRTGRTSRRPRQQAQTRAQRHRQSRVPAELLIAHRPAEATDRAVPGHWEGDLILGSTASGSAIGTLVERTTGFVMLLHLPGDHTATTVAAAMIATVPELPEQMWRSLTWDQGSEMARHAEITTATGLAIYFADPHSPWQRPSNENTNGLLRQYFPKGTDLSLWGPGYLTTVAAELNARPRKRLDWATPAEAMHQLLSDPDETNGVATTA